MKRIKPRSCLMVFFWIYVALMLVLLFARHSTWIEGLSYKQMIQRNINLTPLLTIRDYWNVVYYRTNDEYLVHCIINLAGNVGLFIPIGYMLPALWKRQKNFFRFLLTCFTAIVLVETGQLLSLRGSFDVDDIILNMAGFFMGYLVYILTHIRFKKKKR